MKWRRERHYDVPPLDMPGDLSSGTEARKRAERQLDEAIEQRRVGSVVAAAIRVHRQENHLQEILLRSARRG